MALPAGKTIKEVYGKDVDVKAPLKVSPLLEAQAKHLDEGKSLSSLPTKVSERSTKGVAAKKDGEEGGRRKSRRRRHSKKTKRTRRHSRKH